MDAMSEAAAELSEELPAGRVEVRSDRETGTTFVVRLPYAVPGAPARPLTG